MPESPVDYSPAMTTTQVHEDPKLKDVWKALHALTGKHPELILATDGWYASLSASIVLQNGESVGAIAPGETISGAVIGVWELITNLGEDEHLYCRRRALRWGGPLVGFVPCPRNRSEPTNEGGCAEEDTDTCSKDEPEAE